MQSVDEWERDTNKKMRWRRRNKIVRRVLGGDNSTRPINGQQQICQWNTFQTTLETILFIGATNGLIGSRHNRSFISFFFLLLFLLYFFPRTADIENFITKDSNRCWWRYVTLLYMRQCVIIIIIIRTLLRATWFDDQQQFFYFFYFLLFLM